MDIIACLMKVGLTRHESMLYLTLCKEGELTGYEAAKVSGIPRSNAYLALAGLVEKGGAYRIESDVVRYTAVKPEEFSKNLRRDLEEVFKYIEEYIPSVDAANDPFINITGKTHMVNKVKNIITSARERIYLSISPYELEYIRKEISEARDRGLKVVIITCEPFEMEGVTVYYHPKRPGQIRLIADTEHVLTGELGADGAKSTCLYSKNPNLVDLIKDSLTNEIKLIKMKNTI